MNIEFDSKYKTSIRKLGKMQDVSDEIVVKLAVRFYQMHMAHVQKGAVMVKWLDRNGKEVSILPKKRKLVKSS